MTPLFWAIAEKSEVETVQMLISKGARLGPVGTVTHI